MEALEPAHPALAEHLKEYKHMFNQVARDCNLPDAPLKPDCRRHNTPRASSRAVFSQLLYFLFPIQECLLHLWGFLVGSEPPPLVHNVVPIERCKT